MEGFTNLQSIEGCSELQMVDETVTFQREQLESIEAALESVQRLSETREELAQATATIESLRAEISAHEATEQNNEQQIAQLQATIDKLNSRPDPTAYPGHNGSHVTEVDDNKDPEDYCRQLIKELN